MILKYAPLKVSDYDKDELSKLFTMSLRSESTFVRSRAILNLCNLDFDSVFKNAFKEEILKLESNPPKNSSEREKEFIEQFLNK